MTELARVKLDHCSEFKDILRDSDGRVIVEDTTNHKWGRGTPDKPGKNAMGIILMELAAELQGPGADSKYDAAAASNQMITETFQAEGATHPNEWDQGFHRGRGFRGRGGQRGRGRGDFRGFGRGYGRGSGRGRGRGGYGWDWY